MIKAIWSRLKSPYFWKGFGATMCGYWAHPYGKFGYYRDRVEAFLNRDLTRKEIRQLEKWIARRG
jgi:hypothetical protein